MSTDFGVSISEAEEPSNPDAQEVIRQDQFGRTVIELNQTQESSIPPSPSSTSPPVLNGNSDEIETTSLHSVYTAEYNNDSAFDHNRSDSTRKEDEFKESDVEDVEKKPMDHVDSVSLFCRLKRRKKLVEIIETSLMKLCKLRISDVNM